MQDAQALEMAVGRGSQRKDEAESSNSLLIREGRFQYGSNGCNTECSFGGDTARQAQCPNILESSPPAGPLRLTGIIQGCSLGRDVCF